jgi:hypothetical protein
MYRILVLILVLSSTAHAADKIGILKIYEQFTLASAAAAKCESPDKQELTDFLVNYQIVLTRTLMEIKERKPSLTNKQAEKIISSGNEKATEAVYSVINTEGCESQKIQDLIKLFHLQAKWNPYG